MREQALGHPAWTPEAGRPFERLEFLGDRVLGLAVTEELLIRHPDADAGALGAAIRTVVSRARSAAVARRAGLDAALRRAGESAGFGQVEEVVRSTPALAAVVEAVLGAIFLAEGYAAAAAGVRDLFADELAEAMSLPDDAKSRLKEEAERLGRSVEFRVVDSTGPPHRPSFVAVALVGGVERGRGDGPSKRAAEQAAAADALDRAATAGEG